MSLRRTSPDLNRRWRRHLIIGAVGLCVGLLIVAGAFIVGANKSGQDVPPPPVQHNGSGEEEPMPELSREFIFGVTVDRINELDATIDALQRLPERPTARIVFDEHIEPAVYHDAVGRLALASDLMGEILDSFYVKEYTLDAYRQRAEQYVAAFSDKVSIWEIGNEINGEWLLREGEARSVVAEKVAAAYDIVELNKGKSAITLYYNKDCWEKPEHEMFRWVDNELPLRVKSGVDYVFISYYESDCNNLRPDWQNVFERLRQEFPSAKLGFGEVGASEGSSAPEKEKYLRRYYSIRPDIEGFVGGYFWWYFWPDMVEPLSRGNTRMIDALSDVMKR